MITRADVQEIWEKVKANSAALDACVGPHDFHSTGERKVFPKYRCTKCGGEISGQCFHWYEAGLKHGVQSKV